MNQAFVMVTSAVVGLVAGALGPIVIAASLMWFYNVEWPPLTHMGPWLARMSALGLLSGSIGGWDGWRSGLCRMWPRACASMLLLLLLAISETQFFHGRFSLWSHLLHTIVFWAPTVWLACWAGQCVGVRDRTKHAEPCAGSDGGLRPVV
jgi:hypothetical protein